MDLEWDQILGSTVMHDYDPQAKEWTSARLTKSPRTKAWDFGYSNSHSTKYKAIVATWNNGIVNINGRLERAPDRWSNVTWAYWKLISGHQGKDASELTHVCREHIGNPTTQHIIDDILGQSREDPLPPHLPIFYAVRPPTPGFFALLPTSNVIGTLYMLWQYPNGLRMKTMQSIHIAKLPPLPRSRTDELYAPRYFLVIGLARYAADTPGTIDTA